MATSAAPPQKDKLIFAPGATDSTTTDNNNQPTPQRAAQFQLSRLSRPSLSPSPFTQFHTWFTHPALTHSVPETTTLSTAHLPSGRVSSRVVYLKELDARGFVIYSNFGTSRKAADIATNPFASLCFWWKDVERQVRVEGRVERLTDQESQVYFDTRARGSRVGAWASRQSSVLTPRAEPDADTAPHQGEADAEVDDGRAELDAQVAEVQARFVGQEHIPVPPFWGGLRIVPETVEFWQGRESRLHDRFRYTRVDAVGSGEGSGEWKIERLSP
ncbi:hypothetical protein LTR84_005343 [Exophiala bonariae]|uniref:pyridoxal 5'-phosphate synthase n=1 Tax=Exophiala bonariae TaxID=1690606 RepID=A0AAV9N3I8_9EURO|nr:hypothetical protein LTR84_005343 [Exophiala bonariae]